MRRAASDASPEDRTTPSPFAAARRAFDDRLERFLVWRDQKIASPAFQSWAARFWLTRALTRQDAGRLYDLTAGFVYAQTLAACVELGVLEALRAGAKTPSALAGEIGLRPDRAGLLLQAAAGVGLLSRRRDGRFRLSRLGAATLGAPGLQAMIRHHRLFYADLADPVALLREQEPGDTALSRFWPYVRGGDAVSPEAAAEYSELMAASQGMVAEETLAAVSLADRRVLLDVGGGAGAFLTAAAQRWPHLQVVLFDLPAVAAEGGRRLSAAGLGPRAGAQGGSFLEGPLPEGADAISLVRVLYDHDDDVAAALLRRAREALAPGGLLIVSEPMSGGARPAKAGDAYFGFYTLAMTTGRPRSADRHAAMLRAAGFEAIAPRRVRRPFITSVLTARKPL